MSENEQEQSERRTVNLLLTIGTPLIVASILGCAGMLWQLSNKMERLTVQVDSIPGRLEAVGERATAQIDAAVAAGRLREAELRIGVAESSAISSRLQAQVGQLQTNDNQQWPRLRNHGSKIELLRNELIELCLRINRVANAAGHDPIECNLEFPEPEFR